MSDPKALYDPVLLKHARAPARRGRLADATHEGDAFNRPCGDHVTLTARVSDRIDAIRFEGEGCALCLAAASALCDAVEGQTIEGARATALSLQSFEGSGDLAVFAAAKAFASRHGCVTLAASILLRFVDQSTPANTP